MLLKVNPTKQNIQTEQGALVTGSCYVQLHTPLTDARRWKVLNIKQKEKEEEEKPTKSTSDPFVRDP